MKKYIRIIIAVLIMCFVVPTCTACDGDRYSMDGKDWGANYDWGEDHFWNTKTHRVEEKWW